MSTRSTMIWKKTELIVLISWFALAILLATWNREIYTIEMSCPPMMLLWLLINRVLLPNKYRGKGRTAVEIIFVVCIAVFALMRIADVDDQSIITGVVFFIFWVMPITVPILMIWYLFIDRNELRMMKRKEFSLK